MPSFVFGIQRHLNVYTSIQQKWFESGGVINIFVCTRFNSQTTFVWVYYPKATRDKQGII
jgi:hypothetical protein